MCCWITSLARLQLLCDNVLADLGFKNAQELTAKAFLAVKFKELVEKRGLSSDGSRGYYGN